MEGDEQHQVVLACTVCGVFFCVLSPLSFWILWAVNWRPWRIYRCDPFKPWMLLLFCVVVAIDCPLWLFAMEQFWHEHEHDHARFLELLNSPVDLVVSLGYCDLPWNCQTENLVHISFVHKVYHELTLLE